ncbi:MAG: hydroxymethylbilane synthase [Puniceicoccaceae bacterium]
MGEPIVLGTRRSRLALVQSAMVRGQLLAADDSSVVVLSGRRSMVDRDLSQPLEHSGGEGLFTSELEALLRAGEIDGAVHSAKDLPTTLGEGLVVAAYPNRADPRDVLVSVRSCRGNPRMILTGSPRRKAQLALLFPEAAFGEIRGNVETRLEKVASGVGEATVLAKAGLDRLGIHSHPDLDFRILELEEMTPAPGQGAIALECREERRELFCQIDRPEVREAVELEKFFLQKMGGGCHSAEGAFATGETFWAFDPERGRACFRWPESAMDFAAKRAFIAEEMKVWFSRNEESSG